MSHDTNISPVNPIPPIVLVLFLVIMGIESVLALGARGLIGGPEAVGWRLENLQRYAFSGEIYEWMRQTGRWPLEHVARFVTYPFVHDGFTQALFAGVILLAMGKMVAEAFGQVAMAVIFVGSGIGGALAYAVLLDDPAPIVGAFPPVYGLIGGYTYLLWRALATVGANQSRAFTLIGFLMGIQLLFGLLFGASNDWLADLAGFATGFGLSVFFEPGGWARLRQRVQRD